MKPRIAVLLGVLALCAGTANAAEQEDTFTIPESGADYVDGKKLSKLMERADPKAATNIGWLYARGQGGVKQDYEEAMKWWRFAASRGYTPAMNNLGLMHANGDGVAQSFEEAFKWWMRSAERGDAWAMNAVGDMYETGQGAPKSPELAMTWYREAAREGDPLGMWNVGHLYEEGLGTDPNAVEASQWYRMAAEIGYPSAMLSLARLLSRTGAEPHDDVEAYALLNIAVSRFTEEHADEAKASRELLQDLGVRLTAEQKQAAESRRTVLDGEYRKPEKPGKDGSSI